MTGCKNWCDCCCRHRGLFEEARSSLQNSTCCAPIQKVDRCIIVPHNTAFYSELSQCFTTPVVEASAYTAVTQQGLRQPQQKARVQLAVHLRYKHSTASPSQSFLIQHVSKSTSIDSLSDLRYRGGRQAEINIRISGLLLRGRLRLPLPQHPDEATTSLLHRTSLPVRYRPVSRCLPC